MTRTSLPAAAIATLVYAVSQVYIGGLVHQLRPNIFVLQLSFQSDRYWAVLGQWGEAGLRSYRAHLPWDFAHLFIYAAFGYVLATRAGLFGDPDSPAARRTAWMLPLAASGSGAIQGANKAISRKALTRNKPSMAEPLRLKVRA